MIRLRGLLRRAHDRRWLGLVLLLLLALLLAFVALHPVVDEVVHSSALVCAMIVLLTTTLVVLLQPALASRRSPGRSIRPPPRSPVLVTDAGGVSALVSFPLRR